MGHYFYFLIQVVSKPEDSESFSQPVSNGQTDIIPKIATLDLRGSENRYFLKNSTLIFLPQDNFLYTKYMLESN